MTLKERDKTDFSVSICVYGGDNPEQFDVALQSIINQTIKPKEIVLTVDGPIPNTILNVIDKYEEILDDKDTNFIVILLDENVGHGEARRIGIKNCTCELIALMDADDISVENRFEKQLLFFDNNPEVSVVGGNIVEFITDINPSNYSNYAGARLVPASDDAIKQYLKKRCPMNQVTVMFKKKDVLDVGGYLDWYCEEDYYLWIRLAMADKKFANLMETLVYVRVGEEMYQRRGGFRYFRSEYGIQKLLLKSKIITIDRFAINVIERFVLQVVFPNRLRGWFFKNLARN